MKLTIPLPPRTKKNSMQKTKSGKLIPSDAYLQYKEDCKYFIKRLPEPINYPVNVKAIYYMDTKRVVDLNNLHSALMDLLVDFGVLEDDNSRIVVSTDGSRVLLDRENPRTEIIITEVEG